VAREFRRFAANPKPVSFTFVWVDRDQKTAPFGSLAAATIQTTPAADFGATCETRSRSGLPRERCKSTAAVRCTAQTSPGHEATRQWAGIWLCSR